MATMIIRKAERSKAQMRIGVSGPSGSGKTYGALQLAFGITGDWSKILLIDTENGSGDLYSHLGDYMILSLNPPFSPERFIEAIHTGEDSGAEIIIIDSVTHEWDGKGGCLESNELLAQTKFKGNTWSAWSVTTPRHQKFIDAITQSTCHVITTARSKTDTIQTEDKKIKKVGLKDIQREGFEYELTIAFNIDRDGHLATASKDRTGLFIDRDPFRMNSDTGKEIAEWNESGIDPEIQKKNVLGLLLDEINSASTIQELVEAFNHAKDSVSIIGTNGLQIAIEAKETKKAELAGVSVHDSEVPEEQTTEQ